MQQLSDFCYVMSSVLLLGIVVSYMLVRRKPVVQCYDLEERFVESATWGFFGVVYFTLLLNLTFLLSLLMWELMIGQGKIIISGEVNLLSGIMVEFNCLSLKLVAIFSFIGFFYLSVKAMSKKAIL